MKIVPSRIIAINEDLLLCNRLCACHQAKLPRGKILFEFTVHDLKEATDTG